MVSRLNAVGDLNFAASSVMAVGRACSCVEDVGAALGGVGVKVRADVKGFHLPACSLLHHPALWDATPTDKKTNWFAIAEYVMFRFVSLL